MCADSLENRHSEAKFSALLQFCKQLLQIRNLIVSDLIAWVGFAPSPVDI
jgi:hypothetical protein